MQLSKIFISDPLPVNSKQSATSLHAKNACLFLMVGLLTALMAVPAGGSDSPENSFNARPGLPVFASPAERSLHLTPSRPSSVASSFPSATVRFDHRDSGVDDTSNPSSLTRGAGAANTGAVFVTRRMRGTIFETTDFAD